MTDAVDSPSVPLHGARLWPLSVAAYHVLVETGQIPENTELLYGLVYAKMPKSPFHWFHLVFLKEALHDILRAGLLLRTESPITCADSEPEPDIAVVSGDKLDYRHQHPHTAELVIEICVTTHDYDRFKLRAYAEAGVKECWLVLGPEKRIEVYRRPEGGRFADFSVHGPVGNLGSAALPEFAVALESLFSK